MVTYSTSTTYFRLVTGALAGEIVDDNGNWIMEWNLLEDEDIKQRAKSENLTIEDYVNSWQSEPIEQVVIKSWEKDDDGLYWGITEDDQLIELFLRCDDRTELEEIREGFREAINSDGSYVRDEEHCLYADSELLKTK